MSRRTPDRNWSGEYNLTNRRGAEEARRAHNPEVIRSKRIAGITTIHRGTLGSLLTSRRSSAEERLNPRSSPLSTNGLTEGRLSAHNGEDVGSKPTVGIIRFLGGDGRPLFLKLFWIIILKKSGLLWKKHISYSITYYTYY